MGVMSKDCYKLPVPDYSIRFAGISNRWRIILFASIGGFVGGMLGVATFVLAMSAADPDDGGPLGWACAAFGLSIAGATVGSLCGGVMAAFRIKLPRPYVNTFVPSQDPKASD
jgi:hypothetical protein